MRDRRVRERPRSGVTRTGVPVHPGSRAASHRGERSRAAGRSTQRHTRSSTSATGPSPAATCSVRDAVVAEPARGRTAAGPGVIAPIAIAAGTSGRADERQRDDRMARRERHAPPRLSLGRRRRRESSCRVGAPTPHREARPVDDGFVGLDPLAVERDAALGDRATCLPQARHEPGVDQRLRRLSSPPRPRRAAARRAPLRSVARVERGQVTLTEQRLGCRDHRGRRIRRRARAPSPRAPAASAPHGGTARPRPVARTPRSRRGRGT